MKYLILLLISFNTLANNELTVSYMKVNQSLFGDILFPMDAVRIDYNYVSTYPININISLARSDKTANSKHVQDLFYTNTMNIMYSASLFYRHELTQRLYIDVGAGITDYKNTWSVNGKRPSWANETDSDQSYYVKLNYKINRDFAVVAGYYDFYRKNKKDFGKEKTYGFSVGLKYLF